MKRILVFIGLKVAEIGAIIFVPYWLGKYVCNSFEYPQASSYWVEGVFMIFVVLAAILIVGVSVAGIVSLIYGNWEWAGKITRRLK